MENAQTQACGGVAVVGPIVDEQDPAGITNKAENYQQSGEATTRK
ncbi:hypothetical protein ACIG56_31445 [Nocardia fusca]